MREKNKNNEADPQKAGEGSEVAPGIEVATESASDSTEPTEAQQWEAEKWIAENGDKLYCYALRHVSRQDVAEDLVQEAFLAAWRGRASFRGRATLETWLTSILRNKIIDYHRKPKRESQPLDLENEGDTSSFDEHGMWRSRPGRWSDAEKAAENREFWSVLRLCIGELPSHLAAAFRLRETSTDSTEEICKSLQVTPANLSVRLHRARVLLRGCLEEKWF